MSLLDQCLAYLGSMRFHVNYQTKAKTNAEAGERLNVTLLRELHLGSPAGWPEGKKKTKEKHKVNIGAGTFLFLVTE